MIDYPRILINRRAALGDILMATPIIRKLYNDRQGKCFIDFSVNPEYEELVSHNPYIKNKITVPYSTINLHNYDIVINLDLVYEKNPKLHPIDAYSFFACGQILDDKETEFYTSDKHKLDAEKFSDLVGNNYIIFHLRNAYGISRNLPLNFWHKLLDQLVNNVAQKIIFIGSMQDNFFQGHPHLIDARGQFDLSTLKEIVAKSKLFVGTDSGPMHIAATTKTDIIAMFTSVKSTYRCPIRKHGNFYPIETKIDCYGCQENFLPPVTSIHCMRNDYECVNRFDAYTIASQIKKILV